MEASQLQKYDEWLTEHLDEIVAQYPGKVIAIHEGKVVIVGDFEGEVYSQIRVCPRYATKEMLKVWCLLRRKFCGLGLSVRDLYASLEQQELPSSNIGTRPSVDGDRL